MDCRARSRGGSCRDGVRTGRRGGDCGSASVMRRRSSTGCGYSRATTTTHRCPRRSSSATPSSSHRRSRNSLRREEEGRGDWPRNPGGNHRRVRAEEAALGRPCVMEEGEEEEEEEGRSYGAGDRGHIGNVQERLKETWSRLLLFGPVRLSSQSSLDNA